MGGSIYGLVLSGTPDGKEEGWYKVATTKGSPGTIVGTSIKGTALTPGQEVDIITCGDEKAPEYGFIEREKGLGSVFLLDLSGRRSACDIAPASAALAGICIRAGRSEVRFRPGLVTAVGHITLTLTVTDRWSGISMALPVSTDLHVSNFSVGDVVLMVTKPRYEVVGWWQGKPTKYWYSTTPVDFELGTKRIVKMVLTFGSRFDPPSGLEWQIDGEFAFLVSEYGPITFGSPVPNAELTQFTTSIEGGTRYPYPMRLMYWKGPSGFVFPVTFSLQTLEEPEIWHVGGPYERSDGVIV